MATLPSVLAGLQAKGKQKTREIYTRHGMAPDRVYGVSVADMKSIAKTLKGQQKIACELLATGNMDAMYLGGMVADGRKLTAAQLDQWLEAGAGLQMVTEYTIPWLAVENPDGLALALRWIESKSDHVAAAGWNTLSGIAATQPDSALDVALFRSLLDRVVREIHHAPNRTRNCMNMFVISTGVYIQPLLAAARAAAKKIGKVSVNMGDTACKVPDALLYIAKIESAGRIGKKRKTMRC